MARKRKQRRQQHGSAWHWKQTDCWYYTEPGTKKRMPLVDDSAEFRAPFDAAGIAAERVFYFGESVLLPAYRGRGIGHAFFDRREFHARALGRFDLTAFCAVDRDPTDARRPVGHRDNDAFWNGRGYARQSGMTMRLRWNEIDRGEIEHTLTFWLRPLDGGAA